MDPSIVTAAAALGGSSIGAVASLATTYLTQRYQVRRDRISRDLDRREALYAELVTQAAELYVDALDKTLETPERLVGVAATLGRIALISQPAVITAAEGILDGILASYRRPAEQGLGLATETNRAFREPLEAFTRACREEREALLGSL